MSNPDSREQEDLEYEATQLELQRAMRENRDDLAGSPEVSP